MLSLERIMNEQVLVKSKEKERDGTISMSGLGHCLRQLVMQERQYEKKFPEKFIPLREQQLRVFMAGNTYEKVVMDLIKPVVVEYQIPTEYRGIKGTADVIVKDGEQNILVDIKTVNSLKFGYLDKGETDEGYAMQITGYWLGLKDKFKLWPICRIFYVEKDNFLTREVAFKTEDYVGKVNARIDEINLARTKPDTLPNELQAGADGKQPWQCFSCGKKNGVRLWCNYIKSCPVANGKYEVALKEK